jgi:hypothetical protein
VTHLRSRKVAAVDLYSIHDPAARLLREAEVSDELIVAIVGHSSLNSTNACIHARQGPTREAMAVVADAYGFTFATAQIES